MSLEAVEICFAILLGLNAEAVSADALIADFEAHQWLAGFVACAPVPATTRIRHRNGASGKQRRGQGSDRREPIQTEDDGISGSNGYRGWDEREGQPCRDDRRGSHDSAVERTRARPRAT